jgi:secreted trypsin-like serine protease
MARHQEISTPEPIPEHIENQRKSGGPFYCGTAFCGHSTIKAAAKCWNTKCEALARIKSEANELRKSGKNSEAEILEISETAKYYPEQNPNNWPINRSVREMQREYIQRAKAENKETSNDC